MARNKVIAGAYEGYHVKAGYSAYTFNPPLLSSHGSRIEVNRNSVRSYAVVTNDHRKSATSGILRGLIGSYFLGSAGMLGGILSAKNTGEYLVAVEFRDGRRSLIEVDDKRYKELIRRVF